jgi:signal transduction histidine kinase
MRNLVREFGGMARKHTILVVDDEPDVVKSVQDLLRLDYKVLGATRAQEGIKLLHDHEVHIVMTDQRMPGMTGVEFLSRLRGEYPWAIRLLFTGYADIKAVIEAINQGSVFRYIAKPWDPDELQSIIRQAAEHYDLLIERQRLLKELQVKNQELERANGELRQASELKTAFIKVASHELRTPLTILLGMSELVLQEPDMPPEARRWLESIHGASVRLQRSVDQMTKMLLAERFERSLECQPAAVQDLLREAVEEVRPFVARRHQQLEVECAPETGLISVEADKIRDSLEHLLLNAIKFTPDQGTIRLTARRTPRDELEIQVSDTGLGIDSASLPRVFDPFFTGFDVSHHASGQFEFGRRGLGLGLSLVKAFVEMHGGKVAATSERGHGSTFTITLPLRNADR